MTKTKLTFQYKLPPSLRGRSIKKEETFEVYPLVPIQLYHQGRILRFEALLDSGADILFLPRGIADALKVTLGDKKTDSGVSGQFESRELKVGLIIGSGARAHDLGVVEACTSIDNKIDPPPILIGRHPVFDKYKVVFEQYKRKFYLELKV